MIRMPAVALTLLTLTASLAAADFSAPFEEKPDYVPGARAPGVLGIDSITLRIPDLAASLAFFTSATGLTALAPRQRPTDVDATLQAPNLFLHLREDTSLPHSPSLPPVNAEGVSHLCYQSHASAPGYPRFKAAGARDASIDAPVDLGGYGVTYAYLYTPAGLMIESEQLDFARLAHETPRDAETWLSHVALVTEDILPMLDFYRTLLDIAAFRQGKFGPSPTMDRVTGMTDTRTFGAWFNVGNLHIELWQYVTPATAPRPPASRSAYEMISFEVADLDATGERLEEAGIAMNADIRHSRFGRSLELTDPDGNRLRLIEFSEAGQHLSVRSIDYHRADFRVAD